MNIETVKNSSGQPWDVRQVCFIFPAAFNVFLEYNMQEIRQNRYPSVSIGRQPFFHMRFLDGIDLLRTREQKSVSFLTDYKKVFRACKMAVSSEQCKQGPS